MTLVAWVLAALLHFAPVEKLPRFAGYEETPEQARARFASIAADIVAAVEANKGTLSDRTEAALLAAVAIGESGLALDTDRGPCFRKGAYRTRCDSGLAATIWQLQAVRWEGQDLRAKDLFADRPRAARIALRAALSSLHRCRHLPAEDRLAALGGSCKPSKSATARYRLWQRVRAWEPR